MNIIRKFAQVEQAVGERQIRVIASDATPDRAGDVMDPAGCDPTDYRNNPVVLYSHDPTQPVGTADVAIKNGRVETLITFAAAGISKIADEVCALAKQGILSACSIGIDPVDREPRKGSGWLYKVWNLLELSIVAVPANPNALVIAKSHQGVPMPYAAPRVSSVYEETPYG